MSWEPPFSTGTDGAEPTGLRRLLRQPAARRNLTIAAGVLGAALFLMPRGDAQRPLPPANFEVESSPPSTVPANAPEAEPEEFLGTPAPTSSPPESSMPSDDVAAGARNEAVYTIYLYKLPGLAPDAQPGTALDIWVTWKPPLTQRPKVQLLLEGVRLHRIEAGFEQGPVADLSVDERDVPDLIYGERFGSLNAVVRPG